MLDGPTTMDAPSLGVKPAMEKLTTLPPGLRKAGSSFRNERGRRCFSAGAETGEDCASQRSSLFLFFDATSLSRIRDISPRQGRGGPALPKLPLNTIYSIHT